MRTLRAEELRQLTGCSYALLVTLQGFLEAALPRERRGAPYKRSVRTMLVLALVKLRGGQAYRTLTAYWRIPHVTLHRYTLLVMRLLAAHPLPRANGHAWLLVDSTSSRLRSTAVDCYSGYKHHRCGKVQLVADDQGRIVDVSPAYSGSVHDKTIWNHEFERLRGRFDRPVLGDKAYAGGRGEDQVLFRPVKRNEVAWKADETASRAYNRELSRIRVKVEHVFARLKAFRIIRDQFALRADRYGLVVRAIALIHNLGLDVRHAA